ncbi:hypothetical protein MEO93_27460, partial [Dolichospermum sp. ST_sed3]|nr:hypothetical protein [Dolichospermum sp. ST_sed3]
MNSFPINTIFDYFPGNHGLTEEVIYFQQPTDENEKIPIFSGSKNNESPIGYIKLDAVNKVGNKISYFQGPCIILTKDGSAGLLTFKSLQDGLFTLNHHACVLKPKVEFVNKVDLEWFALQYHDKFLQYVTSKSDNGVFSTEWFDRIFFELPDIKLQIRQKNKKSILLTLQNELRNIKFKISQLFNSYKFEGVGTLTPISEIFQIRGGNSGLTEEFIYYNLPNNEDESIPIYSGATLDSNNLGYISNFAKPDNKSLKHFKGPAILVIRKGLAGKMLKITEAIYTANDDVYIFELKNKYKHLIDLEWFIYQYQDLFFHIVTSKSDNATFNKEYCQSQNVLIPDY